LANTTSDSAKTRPALDDLEPLPTRGFFFSLSVWFSALIVILAAAWSLDVPRLVGFAFYPAQLLGLILALSVAVAFLSKNHRGQSHQGQPPWFDLLAAALVLGAGGVLSARYANLVDLVLLRPPEAVTIGVILLPLILEALRRTVGWTLVLVVTLFIIYALAGDMVPGRLAGKAQDWDKVASYLSLDVNGVLGIPLQIASTVVIAFVLFGTMLNRVGGAQFFTDAALAVMGGLRGGAMKIAVIASAIFGSISGSAVANVMSTGVVTIPMIKRSGYPGHKAAAIEAVASTGGQLLPPVMGASAFLMAEFLYVPYATVAMAALVPGLLYYVALFVQAHLEAVKHDIAPVPKSQRPKWQNIGSGWHFLLAFLVLIATLFFFNWQPAKSALAASATVLISAAWLGYQGRRPTPKALCETICESGRGSVDLVLICAAAGMVIGVLNMTGLSFNLTYALVQMGGGSKIALLVMSAVVCIVLGMGLPTLGVYVLLATLVAPALVELGVDKVAAHLFVLYFGMMSMITPPVAVAAFAAAGIAQANPMRTGLESMRFGWPAYVVPFLFALSPTLILKGSAVMVAVDVLFAVIGVGLMSVAVSGYFQRAVSGMGRWVVAAAGLMTLLPHAMVPGGVMANGVAAGVGLAALFIWGRRVGNA
jgi:TRAP transporter 4TM/12TM fusion protein